MATYDESKSGVLNTLLAGISAETKAALESVLGNNVKIADYGDSQQSQADVVNIPAGTADVRDPGSKVVVFANPEPVARAATDFDYDVTFDSTGGRVVIGSEGNEKLIFTGSGNVTFEAGGGDDSIKTGAGDDVVTMNGNGDSSLDTGDGDDYVLIEGMGTRQIVSGKDDSVFVLNTDSADVTIDGGAGFDELQVSGNRGDYEFFTKGDQALMIGDNLTRLENVNVVTYEDDSISVLADSYEVSILAKMYQITLGREADLGGLESWSDALKAGFTLNDVAYGFVNSTEFKEAYGSLTNEQFLNVLYENMRGEAPDAAGFQAWMSFLDAGIAREDVALAFAESVETDDIYGINGEQYVIDLF